MTGLVVDIASWILLVAGGVFLVIGSVGLIRFPDFWARLHAASIVDSAGAGLMIAGLILQAGLSLITVKLLLLAAILFFTGPTASHAVANAALVSGLRPKDIVRDDTDVVADTADTILEPAGPL